MVALVHTLEHFKKLGLEEAPATISATSLPQQWSKPRGSKIENEPVSHVIFTKPKESRKKRPLMNILEDTRSL